MHYIFEALIVGTYTAILYKLLSPLFDDEFIVFLFVLGFTKHMLGYFLSIHDLYCEYGRACSHLSNQNKANASTKKMIIESSMEAVVFVIFGYVLSFFTKDRLLLAFALGFFLHIIAELIGIHKKFCQRCIQTKNKLSFEALMFHAR